jgi:hypothetical protein
MALSPFAEDENPDYVGRPIGQSPRIRYPSMMEIHKILAELKEERDQLNEAILSLERLITGQGKRRGRPPLWLTNATVLPPKATDGPMPPGSNSKRPT